MLTNIVQKVTSCNLLAAIFDICSSFFTLFQSTIPGLMKSISWKLTMRFAKTCKLLFYRFVWKISPGIWRGRCLGLRKGIKCQNWVKTSESESWVEQVHTGHFHDGKLKKKVEKVMESETWVEVVDTRLHSKRVHPVAVHLSSVLSSRWAERIFLA